MKTSRRIYWSVLALSLSLNAVLLMGGSAWAAKGVFVGTVDLAHVMTRLKQSPQWVAMTAQLTEARNAFRADMQRLTKTRYLTRDQKAELSTLKAKATPTPAERSRLEALEGTSNALDREVQELAVIERPNEMQRVRLVELQRLRESGLEALRDQDIANSRRETQIEADLLRIGQKRVEEAASEVARERNLELVVDRQLVLFGGQDVTADIVDRLPLK